MALAPIKGISGTYFSDKNWVNTVIGTDQGLYQFGSFGDVIKDKTLGVDSLTKQSQTSRSNVSHLVVDVLLQDCG